MNFFAKLFNKLRGKSTDADNAVVNTVRKQKDLPVQRFVAYVTINGFPSIKFVFAPNINEARRTIRKQYGNGDVRPDYE